MVVTNIESITKTKYRVYIDDEFAFVLYKGELFKYQIRKEEEISEEIIIRIENGTAAERKACPE